MIDLFAEHRVETNGRKLPCGNNLLGALTVRNLAHIDAGEKEDMRRLILDNRQWSEAQKRSIMDYCASDVTALVALWPVMEPTIDMPRALLRGRYMAAVARMERTVIPIDAPLHRRLVKHWEAIKERLIAEVDRDFQAIDGTTFKRDVCPLSNIERHPVAAPALGRTGSRRGYLRGGNPQPSAASPAV